MADILDSGNTEPVTLNAGDGDSISLPEDFPLTDAEFQTSGDDLVLVGPDGEQIVIEDYFAQENPPELTTPDGAEVSGDMVVQLSGDSGTDSAGNDISAGTDGAGVSPISESANVIGGTDGEPIGSVENVSGTVFAVRTDGTRIELQEGDQVFQGDILESGPDGAIGVLLADETTFSMGEEGRMVLDEMIYDPGTQEGSVSMSVLQGVFTFVSGQVAKTDPDAMTLDTPVATIGIRGTQVGIEIPNGEDMNVVLMEEADGFVGEIVVTNDAGVKVLNGANQFTVVRSYDAEPLAIQQINEADMIQEFAIALEHLPLIHGNQNDFGLQQGGRDEFLDEEIQQLDGEPDAAALDNFDTAAGQEDGATVSAGTDNGNFSLQSDAVFDLNVDMVGGTPRVPIVQPDGTFAGTTPEDSTRPIEVGAQVVVDPRETLSGGGGADTLTGGAFADSISGGAGNDVLVGGGGGDTIDGGLGNDILVGGNLDTSLYTVDVTNQGDINLVSLDSGATQAYVEDASDGADLMKGGAGDDLIIGTAGGDTLEGGSGADTLHGGSGDDVIKGQTGDDVLFGGTDNDILSGGAGNDILHGGSGDDTLSGGVGDDALFGGIGNDVLNGGAGVDVLDGGAGDDTLIFRDTDDVFIGGDGVDTLFVAGDIGTSDLVINLATSADGNFDAASTNYSNRIVDVENVVAGAGDDTITGSSADNIITGGSGDDLIVGGGGRDIAAFSATLDQTTVTIDQATGFVTVTGPNGTDTLSDIDVLSFGDGTIVAPMMEDTTFTLNDSRIFDGLEGADTVTVSGLPAGAVLSAGTDNGDGSWTLSATGTSSLGDVLSTVTVSPAPNSNEDFTITVTGQTAPTLNDLGVTVPGTTIGGNDLTLMVQGVIDFDLSGALAISNGFEDQPITLDLANDIAIDVSAMDNSEALSVNITISNVPTGSGFVGTGVRADDSIVTAQLADGSTVEFARNVDGDFVISGFNAQDLASVMDTLTVTPPLNHDEAFTLQLTTHVAETDGATSTTIATKQVNVEAVADAPILTVGGDVATVEDSGRVALEINAAQTDPSEVMSISIEGIPDGTVIEAEYAPGQFIELPVLDGVVSVPTQFMNSLFVTPAADSNQDFALTVNATSTEPDNNDQATTSAVINVDVRGVADDVDLTGGLANDVHAVDQSGNVTGEVSYDLDIAAALHDTDGSESLSITIRVVEGADVYDANGDRVIFSEAGEVSITSSVGVGQFTSEGGGVYTISAGSQEEVQAILDGLKLDVGSGVMHDFELEVTALNTDAEVFDPVADTYTDSNTTEILIPVEVANDPTLGVHAAEGFEDKPIVLNLEASLTDMEGEALSITIGDIPDGAVLTSGGVTLEVINGQVTFSEADINGGILTDLHIQAPLNSSADFVLAVSATSTTADGDIAEVNMPLPVQVAGIADNANLNPDDVIGDSGTAIPLTINASLSDTDGSETLSITISNIPDGAVLSAGTVNLDGSVTLTPNELVGLTITPPDTQDNNFSLFVSATTTEADGDTATVSDVLNVTLDLGAQAPTVTLGAAQGGEDSAIPLNIDITPEDLSETLSVTISGIPDGAVLSAGTLNPDGTVTFTDAMIDAGVLANLTITPPADSNVDFNLNVAVTSTDGADQITVTDTLAVDVVGVADAPNLTTQDSAGGENTAIPLDLTSTLNDVDGSESLSITISNIPVGATLSAGVVNLDGSVTLSAGELVGLTITPALNSEQDFGLQVTATSTENDGDTASISGVINVNVIGGADIPTLTLTDAAGNEDSAIALSIDAALTDATETLSITISDIPEGAVLMSGNTVIAVSNTGVANLLPEQLTGLTITPPDNSNTDFTLTITATSTTEGGEFVDTTAALAVEVKGVADAPTLQTADAVGSEDDPIALDITSALTDTDGSESLSISISGVPSGAVLSAGTDNGDGSWTLSATQLDGLSITPPTDFDGEFDLTVVATSTDTEAAGETPSTDTAVVSGTIHVTVENDAEPPVLVIDDVVGKEDTPIALNIDATAADGSELLSVTINGIPDGAALSAGTVNLDGSVTLTPDELVGLTITPPDDSNVNFDLTVTATSQDGSETFSTTDTMAVDVAGVADVPTLNVSIGEGTVIDGADKPGHGFGDDNHGHGGPGGQGGQGGEGGEGGGEEGTVFPLSIESQVTDTDGSETLSITVGGLPTGVELSAGTDNGDGTWTLETGDLQGLNMFVPEGVGTDFNILVTSTSTDSEPAGEAPGTDTASVSQSVGVDLDTDADGLTLDVSDATGNEDGAIALNIDAALADTDGSESLSITVSGVPDGATLSAGVDNHDGTWTLGPADLDGLSVTPPLNSNVDFNLDVTATTTEMSSGDTSTTTATINVDVVGVADAPGAIAQDETGVEDNWIQLNLDSQISADTDGSETLSIVISDVPDGARLNPGTDNGDGTWTATAAELPSVCILPPDDFSGDMNMTLSVTTTENDGDTSTTEVPFTVTVTPDADTPELNVNAAQGFEDTAIDLDISSALSDSSETLSITISDIPDGATLSVGTLNEDGSVSLTPDQLDGLQITPPTDSNVDFNLTVTATSQDGTDTATSVSSLAVDVVGVADAPSIEVSVGEGEVVFEQGGGDGEGSEHGDPLGSEFPLSIDSALSDTDGSETLSLSVGGLPTGVVLSAGTQNSDGSWTLNSDQLDGLTMFVPTGVDSDFNFSVTSTATENDGDTASASQTVNIDGDGETDGGSLDVSDATGSEDSAIALDIGATLNDTDGSESLSITVSGVPDGAVLSAGTDNGDGSWTLASANLEGLTITPPENSNVDFDLTVTSTTTEASSGATSTTTATINVGVAGVADAPTLSVALGEGIETSASIVPVSYWKLDETGGNDTLADTVGNHDGTPVNKLRDMDTTRGGGQGGEGGEGGDSSDSGPYGTAAGFGGGGHGDSRDEYIEVDHSADLKPHNGTLTMWINPDDVDGASSLASSDAQGADTPGGFNLRLIDGVITLEIEDETGTHHIEGGNIGENEWSQVTASWGDDGMNLYVNGEVVASDSEFTGGVDGNLNPWTFGASQGASSDGAADQVTGFYNGHIDDIAIYDQQVGDEVAADLHANGVQATMDTPGQAESIDFPLTIDAGLTDTDGSESLSISIGGLPDGASLSSGTDNGDGSWTLESGQLDGLSLSVPTTSDDFTINVSATTTENDGDSAVTAQLVQVDVSSTGFSGGTETIEGGDGMDVLYGSDGDDVIIGGGGDDILSGGDGQDAFVFDSQSGHDIVTDLMEQDTLVFEGQEFHMDDLVLTENNEGSVVVSFAGVEGASVTLDGVTSGDLNVSNDTSSGDGYSVTEDGGSVTITIDNIS